MLYKGYIASTNLDKNLEESLPLKLSIWNKIFGDIIVIPFSSVKGAGKKKQLQKFKATFPEMLGIILCSENETWYVIIQRGYP